MVVRLILPECKPVRARTRLTTRAVRPLSQRIVLGKAVFGYKTAWTWLGIMTHA
jgi:hypothetical protein